jgi:hypothetical protein
MLDIPSQEDGELNELYREVIRTVSDALQKPTIIYATSLDENGELLAYLKSWSEADMEAFPWDTYSAIKSVLCYPLELTVPDGVGEDDPHVVITCNYERCGVLLTEFSPPSKSGTSLIMRETLVGVTETVRPGMHTCYMVPNKDRVMDRVLELIMEFYERIQNG